MSKIIDYYFTPISPWTFLGHDRFVAIARKHNAAISVKPINLGRVFPVSGGLPLSKRAPQRQKYRLVELRRWAAHLGIPMNVQPRHFPVLGDIAACWILAALEQSDAAGVAMTGAIGRALWCEEKDITDAAVLGDIAARLTLDVPTLAERAAAPDTALRYDTLTQEAIDRDVFGAPTYLYAGEMFWGQDRLDFLDRALSK
ncbi:MAG TPA: 2-hydroxychromene-2-carboxylate isomerase [Casimicrobiaceae bacterium]|nr:2-hydroxychromene-2-carboxylate isomerase [Casimicrobiaceae bacterium]